MNYTKEEWMVHELASNVNSIPMPIAGVYPAAKGMKIQIVSSGAPIPKINGYEFEYEQEAIDISRNNAHLISAAPDMYEALLTALGALVALYIEKQTWGEGIMDTIKKALAKAEGK